MSFVDLVVRQQTHSLHQLKVARPESIYDNTLLIKNLIAFATLIGSSHKVWTRPGRKGFQFSPQIFVAQCKNKENFPGPSLT